ncbi:MAG: putative transporter [Bacteroides sp.]|nr:putative transporter [Bacteroides sp.]MCM1380206.1 putative transporter [Bacteroides sp.]MCM1446136.1 putative transporter [Prevotella sp.]
MNWLDSLFITHTPMQAVIVLSVIIAAGLGLGKIRIMGVSLGVTFVFFMGILAGHLGFSIDPEMLMYAQNFGLVLFVYELGLKVGPGFFSSFRSGGVKLNMLSLITILLGTLLAVALSYAFTIPMSDMVGILSGATTNTPALGAAQETLSQLGRPAAGAALSCAVTYPLGVVGVILAFVIVRKLFVRPKDMVCHIHEDSNHTYIAAYIIKNPGIFGKSVREIAKIAPHKFVISRQWHDGKVHIPNSDTVLHQNDRILVVTTEHEAQALTVLFGEQDVTDYNSSEIDWNAIDSSLISKHVIITKPEINGKRLGSLKLRNTYGINISRVLRAGVQLLATPGLVLQLGDRLTVVGEAKAIENVEKVLGNVTTDLKEPNLAAIFIGMVLGLVVGAIPLYIPGISQPVCLGLAGGPIVVGILIGAFGPRFHLVTYTTRSANLMLRGIGLSLFLASLGLSSGANFLETVMTGDGPLWIGVGFLITVIPVIIMAVPAMRLCGLGFGETCGMLAGAMANPMALTYSGEACGNDDPAVAYATVYPVTMFVRVIIAQILVIMFV